MVNKIKSYDSLQGFQLKNEIIFEGNLCLLTGKNGSGKTRLIKSLTTGQSKIEIDNLETSLQSITKIDCSSLLERFFTWAGDTQRNKNLARAVLMRISECRVEKDLPEIIHVQLDPNGPDFTQYTFNCKKIIKNAQNLFSKNYNELLKEEVELSLLVHNEIFDSLPDFSPSAFNLSQITINYFNALEYNELLDFYQSKGKPTKALDKEQLINFIGEKSPHSIFGELVNDIFRGKYSISEPGINISSFHYEPKLILNSTGQAIQLQELSSGESTIFWIIAKTFEALSSSSHGTFNNKTCLLMDEPDAYLHPQMISDFFNCLKMLIEKLNVTFILSTHSPTTVALFPSPSIFTIEFNLLEGTYSATKTSKDSAISQLLDGVTQITINPENSRQIYVENTNDGQTYSLIYTSIKNRSKKLDPNITLNFISAGPKIADSELRKHILSFYPESEHVEALIGKINGHANCDQVIGTVEHLSNSGNKFIRGIIDWDNKKRSPHEYITVMAEGYAYSIENLVYDPINLYSYLCYTENLSPSRFVSNTEIGHWSDALNDNVMLQEIIDSITLEVLGRPNKRDHEIHYFNGDLFQGDREYYIPNNGENGHTFENNLLKKYGSLNKLMNRTSGLPIIYYFLRQVTFQLLNGRFLNEKFEEGFVQAQQ